MGHHRTVAEDRSAHQVNETVNEPNGLSDEDFSLLEKQWKNFYFAVFVTANCKVMNRPRARDIIVEMQCTRDNR